MDRIRAILRVRCAAIQLLANHDGGQVTVKWAVRDSESEANRYHHGVRRSGGHGTAKLPTLINLRRTLASAEPGCRCCSDRWLELQPVVGLSQNQFALSQLAKCLRQRTGVQKPF